MMKSRSLRHRLLLEGIYARLRVPAPFLAAVSAATLTIATWTSPARAQQGSAVLMGKVTDAGTKEGVQDVVVTVTSPALQGEQIVTTDATGIYRIPSLSPGAYTLRLDKPGYKLYERNEIQLRADATIRLDAEMLPESFKAEEVVIVAHAPTVDVGSTTSGANINSDFTARIPITNPGARGGAQRTFESVAEATPGATADRFGTSINGATSPENAYVIDGLRTNGPRYGTNGSPLSIEFVKEVNVLSGGYMPEYGRSTGSILNVVTKSGSNEYHGSAWANWTPGALEGARKYPYFVGTSIQTRKSLANVYDAGFDQSGPVVKDKLWYYVGFEASRAIYNIDRRIDRTNYRFENGAPTSTGVSEIAGSNRRYQATSTSYQFFGRLDLRINQDNKLALTFAATPTTAGGGGDLAVVPNSGEVDLPSPGNMTGSYTSIARSRRAGAYDTILKWTSEFDNKSKHLETTLGWHHELGGELGADGFGIGSGLGLSVLPGITYRRTPSLHDLSDVEAVAGCGMQTYVGGSGKPARVPTCPLQTYRGGGPGFTDQQVLDSYAAKSVLTIFARVLGHHVIKAGAELEWSTSWNRRGFSGNRALQETTSGLRFDEVRGYGYLKGVDDPISFDRFVTRTQSINVGGFVQDSWAFLDKVTVNAGLRYDSQFMFGDDRKLWMVFPNQLSPRIGLIFDPSQNGRSKVFASYARFSESIPLNIADRGSERGLRSSEDASKCNPLDAAQANGVCVGAARSNFSAARGWTGKGIPDRRFGPANGAKIIDPDVNPQSMSEFSAGGEYEVVKNGRIGVSYVRRWMNDVLEDMSNDDGATYFIGNPGKGLAKDFPEAVRDYDGGTIYFMKVFADGWLAQASYTLSWLRGNIAGLYRPESGQLDPNSNSTFDLKSLLVNQMGDLPGDSRHNFKVYGAKDFAITQSSLLTVGGSVQARSGAPTNFLGSHAVYGADEAYILPRGSGERLPWNANVGAKLGYSWRFESGMALGFTVDIFNLLNFQGAVATDERYTRADVVPLTNGSRADVPDAIKTPSGAPFDPAQVNPNFGNATAYQEPRQFRFGLRASF